MTEDRLRSALQYILAGVRFARQSESPMSLDLCEQICVKALAVERLPDQDEAEALLSHLEQPAGFRRPHSLP